MALQGKHILLGVTGSIAAYKAAMLVRLLIKSGAQVKVVMSEAGKDFITPLTLATLCKSPVLIDNFDPTNGAWNSHISLGEWADYYIIAPATANTLAKMAGGIADNLLLTTYLSARCPVGVAPAMDLDMYAHPTTQENLAKLRKLGVAIVEPEAGELASGLSGKGRMAEPEVIAEAIKSEMAGCRLLSGRKVLVTAGATVEPIDPVRYISNYSTGKMGYAIADELARRGAEVTLVTGAATATLKTTRTVNVIQATTAEEMYRACDTVFSGVNCAIFCAAVADYTPEHTEPKKIKHTDAEISLRLKPTRDIAGELSQRKREGEQLTIGFALESEGGKSAIAHAQGKLDRKNLDAIILNTLQDPGAGFGTDTNKVTIIDREGSTAFPLKDKEAVAEDIADYLCRRMKIR